jgi:hypothetical protein
MHCVRFEMRLNELLDERVSPDSDLELLEHADDCPACAELLAGHELLLAVSEQFEVPCPKADFAVRVAAQVSSEKRCSAQWNWIWTAPAVAAGVLIAFGLWRALGGHSSDGRSPADSTVQNQQAPRTDLVATSSSRYWQVFSETEANWRHHITEQRPEWVDQMADGLKPVADSMSAAIQALRRTLPGGDAAVRSTQIEPNLLGVAATIG